MLDMIYIGVLFALLAATLGFAIVCDRLAPTDTGSKP